VTYSSFENLADAGGGTFDVTTGSQSGTLAGGTGSTLSYAGNAGAVTVNVSTASATFVKGGGAGGFTNINNFMGSSSTADTLTGANRVWNISGLNSGTVSGTPWSAFENISDSSAGQFVGGGGSVSGSIIGGAGATTLSGIITSGGSQTYNGAVTLASASTLNAGGSNISFASTINGGGNSLATNNTGTLSLGTGIGNVASLSIQGGPSGGVSLPTTALTGNLDIASAGAVTQTGALTVSGTTNISAAGNAITLTNGGNNFGSAVSLSGGTTQIFDINALTFGGLNTGSLTTTNTGALNLGSGTVSGTLSATTNNGSVTQSGGLTVTSNATINTGTGTITLTSANDFQGSLTLTGGTTQITDSNALNLGTVNTGALTTISSGALNLGTGHVAGNLSAASNGGNITQSGALLIDGSSNLQAGVGGIGLTSANTFTGAVSAGAGNIALKAANTLTPGTINAGGGNITLIANGIAPSGQLLGGSANLSSATDVGGSGSTLAINFGFGSVALSGTASAWNLSGPAVPQPLFSPNSQNTLPNVFYNNGCISGIACAGVFTVQASIGSSVSQISAQAQKDAQSTDSVAKAIDYGGVEVGTAGAMQHQIEETGISTPDCLEESRDNQPCRN